MFVVEDFDKQPLLAPLVNGRVKYTAVDATSYFLALATNTGSVFLFNPESLAVLTTVSPKIACCATVLALHSGRYLAVAHSNLHVLLYGLSLHGPANVIKAKMMAKMTHHKGADRITCLEWGDGGKLFSGDSTGVVLATSATGAGQIRTKDVVYKGKSAVVQLHYRSGMLLCSFEDRAVVINLAKKSVHQVGTKDRKGSYGACFVDCTFLSDNTEVVGISLKPPKQTLVYSARPGPRAWLASHEGNVKATLNYKDAMKENGLERPPPLAVVDVSKALYRGPSEDEEKGDAMGEVACEVDSKERGVFSKVYAMEDLVVVQSAREVLVMDPADVDIVLTRRFSCNVLGFAVSQESSLFVLLESSTSPLLKVTKVAVSVALLMLLDQADVEGAAELAIVTAFTDDVALLERLLEAVESEESGRTIQLRTLLVQAQEKRGALVRAEMAKIAEAERHEARSHQVQMIQGDWREVERENKVQRGRSLSALIFDDDDEDWESRSNTSHGSNRFGRSMFRRWRRSSSLVAHEEIIENVGEVEDPATMMDDLLDPQEYDTVPGEPAPVPAPVPAPSPTPTAGTSPKTMAGTASDALSRFTTWAKTSPSSTSIDTDNAVMVPQGDFPAATPDVRRAPLESSPKDTLDLPLMADDDAESASSVRSEDVSECSKKKNGNKKRKGKGRPKKSKVVAIDLVPSKPAACLSSEPSPRSPASPVKGSPPAAPASTAPSALAKLKALTSTVVPAGSEGGDEGSPPEEVKRTNSASLLSAALSRVSTVVLGKEASDTNDANDEQGEDDISTVDGRTSDDTTRRRPAPSVPKEEDTPIVRRAPEPAAAKARRDAPTPATSPPATFAKTAQKKKIMWGAAQVPDASMPDSSAAEITDREQMMEYIDKLEGQIATLQRERDEAVRRCVLHVGTHGTEGHQLDSLAAEKDSIQLQLDTVSELKEDMLRRFKTMS